MRLITIDNGNTNPSVGHFENGILKDVTPLIKYIPAPHDYVLISSVGLPLSIKPSFDLKSKRSKDYFFDMKVNYSETLGDDRLIAGYYLFKKNKDAKKILLIDAGTFITCDLITNEGFQGGYILPGIDRFLKIYTDSAQLPSLSRAALKNISNEDPKKVPGTTQEAILAATTIYLKSTIEEIIKRLSPDKIVFTGGSAKDIQDLINLKVHSETDRHLIHLALSLIHESHLS